MRFKVVMMQVTQVIMTIMLKKLIREKAESKGVAKSFLKSTFLKRWNAQACSATSQANEDHRRQLKWMTIKFFLLLMKNLFTLSSHVKNAVQEVGLLLSNPTNKKHLYVCKYRVFTSSCKPLLTLKKRKARLYCQKAWPVLDQYVLDE